MSKIAIIGGTGLIGSKLIPELKRLNHQVFILTRGAAKTIDSNETYINYDPYQNKWPTDVLTECETIINLAGKNIGDSRLTTNVKSDVYKSRIELTRSLVTFINNTDNKCYLLINSSAAGFYGYDRKDEMLDEDSDPGNGYLAELCKDWENESKKLESRRLVILRTGIVLDNNSGAYPKLKQPILLGLGSALGTGKQWVPWIHINDVINIILYAINNHKIEGPVNVVCPNPVRNKRMIGAISDSLNKAILMPKVPAFALKLILGELSKGIVGGLKIEPKKLKDQNFIWEYYDIDQAVKNLNWGKKQ
ncbi:MAG: TIGR01777 family oxidoreductase [Bacteroidia bacterium]